MPILTYAFQSRQVLTGNHTGFYSLHRIQRAWRDYHRKKSEDIFSSGGVSPVEHRENPFSSGDYADQTDLQNPSNDTYLLATLTARLQEAKTREELADKVLRSSIPGSSDEEDEEEEFEEDEYEDEDDEEEEGNSFGELWEDDMEIDEGFNRQSRPSSDYPSMKICFDDYGVESRGESRGAADGESAESVHLEDDGLDHQFNIGLLLSETRKVGFGLKKRVGRMKFCFFFSYLWILAVYFWYQDFEIAQKWKPSLGWATWLLSFSYNHKERTYWFKPIAPFVVIVTALLSVYHWGSSTVCSEDFHFSL